MKALLPFKMGIELYIKEFLKAIEKLLPLKGKR